jgi:archaemetzincin
MLKSSISVRNSAYRAHTPYVVPKPLMRCDLRAWSTDADLARFLPLLKWGGVIPVERFSWPEALGAMRDVPVSIRAMLADDGGVEPLPDPAPREWLAIHEETGQTFDEFVRGVTRPSARERTIYLQPIDSAGALAGTCLSTLAAFAAAFFQLEVRIRPPLVLDAASLVTRTAPDTGGLQVYAGDILARLYADKPADAFCVLGVTAHDLFPHPIVSFAFGEASAACRVGVCSVARYGPPFCEDAPGRQPGDMRRRCCRVFAHEIGHMAGIDHCVYFRCLMNGSSSLAESDRRPLHLCPVDLRKLQWLIGFEFAERYTRLQKFWRAAGDDDEAAWAAGRLRASGANMQAMKRAGLWRELV